MLPIPENPLWAEKYQGFKARVGPLLIPVYRQVWHKAKGDRKIFFLKNGNQDVEGNGPEGKFTGSGRLRPAAQEPLSDLHYREDGETQPGRQEPVL